MESLSKKEAAKINHAAYLAAEAAGLFSEPWVKNQGGFSGLALVDGHLQSVAYGFRGNCDELAGVNHAAKLVSVVQATGPVIAPLILTRLQVAAANA